MTDSMIERVARASFKCWRDNATKKGIHMDRPQTFDEMPADERSFALAHARAAIEAMREPTEAMESAYWRAMGSDRCGPEACLNALIDAALNE